jgi:multisubunit Na+/H+ antiporter MnhG subunit
VRDARILFDVSDRRGRAFWCGVILGLAYVFFGGFVVAWVGIPTVTVLWSASVFILLLSPAFMPVLRRAAGRR